MFWSRCTFLDNIMFFLLSYFWEWFPFSVCLWGTAVHWSMVLISWLRHWPWVFTSNDVLLSCYQRLHTTAWHQMKRNWKEILKKYLLCLLVCTYCTVTWRLFQQDFVLLLFSIPIYIVLSPNMSRCDDNGIFTKKKYNFFFFFFLMFIKKRTQ